MAELPPHAPPSGSRGLPLDERLQDDNPSVRAHALEDLRDQASPRVIARTAAPLLADPDPGLRERASQLLTSLSDRHHAAREVVPYIADADITTRNLAGEVLVALGEPAVAAIGPYLRDDDHDVRKFAIDLLAQLPADTLADEIAAALDDPDANVRLAAVDAIGALQASEYRDALRDLYDREPLARPDIVHAMGAFGMEADLDLLERGLRDDNPVVQLAAAEALATQGAPEVIELLLSQVDAVDPMARPVVLHSIVELCTNYPQYQATLPDTLQTAFLEMLDDPDVTYRCAAARGLQWLADDAAYETMLTHAGDDDELDMALFTSLLTHDAPFDLVQRTTAAGRMAEGPAATFAVGLLAKGIIPDDQLAAAGAFLQRHFDALDADGKITTLGLCRQLGRPELHGIVEAAQTDPDPQVRSLARDVGAPNGLPSSSPDGAL